MDKIFEDTESPESQPAAEPNLTESLQSRLGDENEVVCIADEHNLSDGNDKEESNSLKSPTKQLSAVPPPAEETTKFLVCGLCKEKAVPTNNAPKLLPCLHSFCEKCLQEKYEQQQKSASDPSASLNPRLKCPSCGQEFLVSSNGISGFLNNQFIIESAGATTVSEGLGHADRVCTSCEDESTVSSFCVNCGEWLCEACVHAHQRVKVTRDHTIKSKEEFELDADLNKNDSNSTSTSGHKPLFCKLHPHEQLRLFCATCDKLTCRDCQLVEHKDHRYQFINEAAGKHREVLKKLLQYLKVNLGLLNETIGDVDKVGKGLLGKEKEVKLEIRKSVENIIKALNQRESVLVAELQGLVQTKLGLLAKQKKDLTQMKTILEHNHDFAKYAVDNGSDVALLYCRKVLGTRLHNLNSLKYRQRPLAYNDLRFSLDVEKMCGYLTKVGTVYSQEDLQRRLEHYGNKLPSSSSNSSQTTSSQTTTVLSSSSGRYNRVVSNPSHTAAMTSSTASATSNSKWTFHNVPPRLNPIEAMSAVNKRISETNPSSSGTKYIALSSPTHLASKNTRLFHRQPSGTHSTSSPGHIVLSSGSSHRQVVHHNGGSATAKPTKEVLILPHPKSANSSNLTRHDIRESYIQQLRNLKDSSSGNASQSANTLMSALLEARSIRNGSKHVPSNSIELVSGEALKQHIRQTDGSSYSTSPNYAQERTTQPDKIHSAPLSSSGMSPNQLPRAKSSSSDPGPATSSQFITSELQVKQEQPDSPPNVFQNFAMKTRPNSLGLNGHEDAQSGESGFDEGLGNDDYCAVCKNGGELLCCDTCPRVFHLQCHVPALVTLPSDSWSCGMCENIQDSLNKLKESAPSGLNRRASVHQGLSENETKACGKLLLELLCHSDSLPFHHRVPNYYKIVTKPMDFDTMKSKLVPENELHYNNVEEFVEDIKQIFTNCSLYNPPDSGVAKLGMSLEEFFHTIKRNYLPHLEADPAEPKPKRRRDEF